VQHPARVANDARWGRLLSNHPVQDKTIMTEHSLWRFSRAFVSRDQRRQREDLEPLIDEDVEWVIHGPIMFPFLGRAPRQGGGAQVISRSRKTCGCIASDRESIMLGVDSAASMMRYSLTALDSNKPISLRLAISRSSRLAGSSAFASSSIPSIWWSKRSTSNPLPKLAS